MTECPRCKEYEAREKSREKVQTNLKIFMIVVCLAAGISRWWMGA